MDRRAFLASAAGATAACVAGCGLRAAVPVAVERGRIRLRLSNHPHLSEPGGFLKLRPAGGRGLIYVLGTEDGFVALSSVCTHMGCTVDVEGARLVCPCHGSMFERTGRVLRGPAERALDRYPVELREDGTLEIALNGSETR